MFFGFRRKVYLCRGAFYVFACSLVGCYLCLELAFPFLLPFLPVQFQTYLPKGVDFLAQNSKKGLFPENYIAIAGDSYALGLGDWLLNSNWLSNPRVRPAHLLNVATGRDVVSFGQAGSGNTNSLVKLPVEKYYAANENFWFSGLTPYMMLQPETMLLFFYEGNDFHDNFTIRNRHKSDFIVMENKAELDSFFECIAKSNRTSYLKRFLFFRFLYSCIFDPYKVRSPEVLDMTVVVDDMDALAHDSSDVKNCVVVDGKRVYLPGYLQSPALDLSGQEIAMGIDILFDAVNSIQALFKKTKIILVYIPAPLSCYELAETVVYSAVDSTAPLLAYPKEKVLKYNRRITQEIQRRARIMGVEFVDTWPSVRRTAAKNLIHGPKDWRHFNRRGYEAMMRPVIDAVGRSLGSGQTQK